MQIVHHIDELLLLKAMPSKTIVRQNANVSWCWPLAACAVRHQLLSKLFEGNAKVAKTKCAQ